MQCVSNQNTMQKQLLATTNLDNNSLLLFTTKRGKAIIRQNSKEGDGKKKITKEMVENEYCLSWNGEKCSFTPPKVRWRKDTCMICMGGPHGSELPECQKVRTGGWGTS